MKVLRLHATGDLRLHDEIDPVPERDEFLLRVPDEFDAVDGL